MRYLHRRPEGCPCCGEQAFFATALGDWGVCQVCGGVTAAMTAQTQACIEPEDYGDVVDCDNPSFGGMC